MPTDAPRACERIGLPGPLSAPDPEKESFLTARRVCRLACSAPALVVFVELIVDVGTSHCTHFHSSLKERRRVRVGWTDNELLEDIHSIGQVQTIISNYVLTCAPVDLVPSSIYCLSFFWTRVELNVVVVSLVREKPQFRADRVRNMRCQD